MSTRRFWLFLFSSSLLFFFFFADFVSCLSRSDPCSCYRREERGSGGVPLGWWWAEFTWNNRSSVCCPMFSLPSLGTFEGVGGKKRNKSPETQDTGLRSAGNGSTMSRLRVPPSEAFVSAGISHTSAILAPQLFIFASHFSLYQLRIAAVRGLAAAI